MTTPLQDAHTRMPTLKGRRVLISGGTTGIGRATARLLAAEGARLFIFGRHRPELDDALAAIRELGEVDGVTADVSVQGDVDKVFAAADAALGGLDILIANAAVWGEGLAEMEDGDGEGGWRYAVETNLLGYLACCKAAAPRLEAATAGQVVLIGSVSADHRSEGSSVYVATKAAIQGFSEAFRKELAKKGLRVTLIEPGLVGADLGGDEPTPERDKEQRQRIGKQEMLRAEDIAVAVHYVLTQSPRANVVSLRVEPLMQDQGD